MAKKKEVVVEETTEQPKVDDTVEKIKVKKRPTMKKLSQDDEVVKVDLSKLIKTEKEDAVSEPTTDASDDTVGESGDSESSKKVVEEVRSSEEEGTVQDEETSVLEEITDEEVKEKVEEITEKVEEAVIEAKTTGKPIPENIQKLMELVYL
jgi:hypothetical protein